MHNVLYEELPESWNGYPINWWFQVGVQMFLVADDKELSQDEKTAATIELLFPEEVPPMPELQQCVQWFLNGWCHDRSPKEVDKRRMIDFEKDQWRIYADFRQIYGINLNEADLHWWEFMGMLWNMPSRESSFLQVIEIRKKRIKSKMSKEEREAIKKAQYIYGLEERKANVVQIFTEEEKKKIDDVDAIRLRMKRKKEDLNEAMQIFGK